MREKHRATVYKQRTRQPGTTIQKTTWRGEGRERERREREGREREREKGGGRGREERKGGERDEGRGEREGEGAKQVKVLGFRLEDLSLTPENQIVQEENYLASGLHVHTYAGTRNLQPQNKK